MGIPYAVDFERNEAPDHIEVVLDPMVQLVHQVDLFVEGGAQVLFHLVAHQKLDPCNLRAHGYLGAVLDGKKGERSVFSGYRRDGGMMDSFGMLPGCG